ncbi:unnamed protein product [Rotaria magnacalcarata]|uniref:Apple domain-containing protein n=4 Tax=Rotaria magnacalcarata TaxID=392030 RepID=A0A819BZY4_9BILA|nr:unnamed protein product [Rotaria magnacalcarata]CAF2133752.1 unnamed protein product [Rotaria magnacalcarata]CAF3804672.1 unnamed protein product [Rotaria magnacalcarata]CAF3806318.1 unnamed protein product [Rotaria magnacalcarata]
MLAFDMLSTIILVVFFSHTVNAASAAADNNQYMLKLNEEILNKLRISSYRLLTASSYQEFELLNDYQCAIECIKDKDSCTDYAFNDQTHICSLFDDSTEPIDENVIKLRKMLKQKPCDSVKCKPDAICIEDEKPRCVCLNGEPTPENCDKIEIGTWTDYSEWSTCSVTCGEGFQFRKRDCVTANDRNQKISSEKCIGKGTEIQPCTVTSCPVYGLWSSWTPCSTFCGIGAKQRNRSCIPPGSNCGNYTFEQRACGEAHCQRVAGIKETEPDKHSMKGYLAIREGDILCVSKESGAMVKHMADLVCKSIGFTRGSQYAVLTPILNNSTCYPGIICDGTEKTFYDCKFDRSKVSSNVNELFAIITRCIVDGGFSAWSEWSLCTKSCDTGQTTRSRTCTEPAPSELEPETISADPSLVGMNCTGEYTQVKTCNEQQC